jgi:hypothetical protein
MAEWRISEWASEREGEKARRREGENEEWKNRRILVDVTLSLDS